MTVLGENIRKIRKKWGLGQGELGKMFDVTRASLSGYENNNNKPDIYFLVKLQQLSHVNAYDIVYTEIDESIISNAPDYDNTTPVAPIEGQAKKTINTRMDEAEDRLRRIEEYLKM